MTIPVEHDEAAPNVRYPIDVEHWWEMDRLERQGRLMTEQTRLFPPQMIPRDGQVIVDVACGPGEWAMQAAQDYPRCQVIGVDLSERMITYARYRADTRQLANVHFEIANVHEGLPFPARSLDIVHARFLTGFLSTTDWPRLFAEYVRVLRPGGMVCSTEFENWGTTTSAAISRLNILCTQLCHRRGQCFAETGERIGVIAAQARLLQEAGFVAVQQQMHALNYSAGTLAHEPMAKNLVAVAQLCEPLFVREQLIDQDAYTLLSAQLLKDLYIETFSGVMSFQAAWGRKPFELPGE